ncbi:MAG TPA: prevent-host-death protein [Mycobacteriales bacterium]|nr:prevent-host-death protein [Mycobacteriales bacterium]
MTILHYDSYTEARAHFKQLLDAAERGKVATLRRDGARTAVVDVERLRRSLATLAPSGAQVVSEGGGWSVFIPGLPVASDGGTFDEAVDQMIDALREYADDWQERLLEAPNHRDNWGLVQLISLSDDHQLRDWLVGSGPRAGPNRPVRPRELLSCRGLAQGAGRLGPRRHPPRDLRVRPA